MINPQDEADSIYHKLKNADLGNLQENVRHEEGLEQKKHRERIRGVEFKQNVVLTWVWLFAKCLAILIFAGSGFWLVCVHLSFIADKPEKIEELLWHSMKVLAGFLVAKTLEHYSTK